MNVSIPYSDDNVSLVGSNSIYNQVGRMVNTEQSKRGYDWVVYIELKNRKLSGEITTDHCTGGIISREM